MPLGSLNNGAIESNKSGTDVVIFLALSQKIKYINNYVCTGEVVPDRLRFHTLPERTSLQRDEMRDFYTTTGQSSE